jgi:hypothetical protein
LSITTRFASAARRSLSTLAAVPALWREVEAEIARPELLVGGSLGTKEPVLWNAEVPSPTFGPLEEAGTEAPEISRPISSRAEAGSA